MDIKNRNRRASRVNVTLDNMSEAAAFYKHVAPAAMFKAMTAPLPIRPFNFVRSKFINDRLLDPILDNSFPKTIELPKWVLRTTVDYYEGATDRGLSVSNPLGNNRLAANLRLVSDTAPLQSEAQAQSREQTAKDVALAIHNFIATQK